MIGVAARSCLASASKAPASLLLFVISIYLASSAFAGGNFQDPLDMPAKMYTSVSGRPLMAIARAGASLVAVGSRGLIITSNDNGRTWTQAKVPVQSDLLAVHFPTPTDGWAVGHNGVVLHSGDGGKTWQLQLDGRIAGPAFKIFYEALGAESASAAKQLALNFQAGPALPFLDVWFEDSKKGYAVGSFGMIMATTDGGKKWEPWLHKIDNPEYLNLNAIRDINGDIYVVGERGQIYRLDRSNVRFTRTDTGYLGSFFGMVGSGNSIVVYGLRGTVYRNTGKGGRWEPVTMPNQQTITAGANWNGGIALVNTTGQVLVTNSATNEIQFRVCPAAKPMLLTGIVTLDDKSLLVTGLGGVRTETVCDAP